MQTVNEERDEATELSSNDSDRIETIRTELREAALIKRKENRVSAWNKSRINLGECPGVELFSIEYIDKKVKLLKRKRISLADYRYLPNALIQVFSKYNQYPVAITSNTDCSKNYNSIYLYSVQKSTNVLIYFISTLISTYHKINLKYLYFIITASIRILANTLHNSYEDRIDILLRNPKYSNEDLYILLNKLLSHPYMHIRRETIWLIGNLYNHKSPSVSKNIRDLIPFLSALNQAFSSVENSV
ncbi:hypothetical protein ALC56_14600 [Trachymyrmex septentrionalis]|uniref:Uncharacterized protein n=1 Tax=Trachymyrmex septentrionalis TaxID=34720 RepID=A0A195ESC6_9HYME|nr:hypothetical protein ALC56_14600 [Trachymyrmex septentrionalis]